MMEILNGLGAEGETGPGAHRGWSTLDLWSPGPYPALLPGAGALCAPRTAPRTLQTGTGAGPHPLQQQCAGTGHCSAHHGRCVRIEHLSAAGPGSAADTDAHGPACHGHAHAHVYAPSAHSYVDGGAHPGTGDAHPFADTQSQAQDRAHEHAGHRPTGLSQPQRPPDFTRRQPGGTGQCSPSGARPTLPISSTTRSRWVLVQTPKRGTWSANCTTARWLVACWKPSTAVPTHPAPTPCGWWLWIKRATIPNPAG